MKKYELTVLLRPELGGEGESKFESRLDQTLRALGGKAGKTNKMGKKQLAYPLQKLNEAIYITFGIELPPNAVIQLEKKLTVDKEILRHLIIAEK